MLIEFTRASKGQFQYGTVHLSWDTKLTILDPPAPKNHTVKLKTLKILRYGACIMSQCLGLGIPPLAIT